MIASSLDMLNNRFMDDQAEFRGMETTVDAYDKAAARSPGQPMNGLTAPIVKLFDHIIGGGEESRGDCQPDGLRGFLVQDQFEFRDLLHGQIGRPCTL